MNYRTIKMNTLLVLGSILIYLSPFITSQDFNPYISSQVSKNVLKLAHKIGQRIERRNEKYHVFSPISIASALELLHLGANGKTYEELTKLLEYENISPLYKTHEEFGFLMEDVQLNHLPFNRVRESTPWKSSLSPEYCCSTSNNDNYVYEINVSNGVFIQNGFSLRPDYKSAVESIYKSDVVPLDFRNNGQQSKEYINNWVNEKTRGRIRSIIANPIDPGTNLIVASTLYLKAIWEKPFFVGALMDNSFYPDGYDAPPIQVKMMGNGGVFPFHDAVEYNCKIIGLPYKGNLSTMYVIQPYDSTRARLRELQNTLDSDKIEQMISKMTKRQAILTLPKMHIQNQINLMTTLWDLGVQSLFSKGYSDFSVLAETVRSRSPAHSPLTVQYDEEPFIFTRFSDSSPSDLDGSRNRRQIPRTTDASQFLQNLENIRAATNRRQDGNPDLYVDEIIHKIDLIINEKGTEGGAVTTGTLRRSGPEVIMRIDSPFMIIIRHDPTKIPLFYGTVYEPTDF